ncbi:hypothetical protein D3C75_1148250 [compost metagenome]
MVVVVIGHFVADRTACRATQPSADCTTGGTTYVVANHLTAGSTQTSANGRFGLLAILGGHGPPGRTAHAGTDRGTGTAPDGLAHHAANGATDTAPESRGGGFAGDRVLRHKKDQCQGE